MANQSTQSPQQTPNTAQPQNSVGRPRSILDFMTPEHRAKVELSRRKREEKSKRTSVDVSPEVFIISELGYYYGWDAIVAVKRGYITYLDDNMKTQKEVFTLDEALALVEGAKKVWAAKVYDQSHGTMIASASKYSKNAGDTFNKNMKPFLDRASLKD